MEELFDEYGHPIDTDSDGQEHPLSPSFALQHHRQRCTNMTNSQVIDDFCAAFSHADGSAAVHESERCARADEIRWRDQTLADNSTHEIQMAKAAGRSADDAADMLESDLVDGRLPPNILTAIAKSGGRCKAFVLARTVTSKSDPQFKDKYGTQSQIPVGKKEKLFTTYAAIKEGTVTLKELDKKDRPWILLAAILYNQPVTLQPIDPDADAVAADASDLGAEDASEPSAYQIIDVARVMDVKVHWILDDATLLRNLAACLSGVDVDMTAAASKRDQITAAKNHIARRLERLMLRLDRHLRNNFVWAACRDNIHSFVQLLAAAGQLPDHVAARSTDEQILLPDVRRYHCLVDGDPCDASLGGVGIYIDRQRCKPVRAVMAWGRTFKDVHSNDEKKSKKPSSEFSRRFPFAPPPRPELGGWSGTFESLTLCVGIGFRSGTSRDCLLASDGAFVWTVRTLMKLGPDRDKRMRFLLQMMQLFYSLMMGKDAIVDGVPFQQHLGPVRT